MSGTPSTNTKKTAIEDTTKQVEDQEKVDVKKIEDTAQDKKKANEESPSLMTHDDFAFSIGESENELNNMITSHQTHVSGRVRQIILETAPKKL